MALYAEFPNGKQPVLWSRLGQHRLGCKFVVPNPKECQSFDHLTKPGRVFKIANKWWSVKGVNVYSFFVPPYAVGIPILLECWPSEGV